jgi:sulfur carrier protein
MKVVLNGDERDVDDGCSVADLVASLGFGSRHVVVERNGEALERSLYDATIVTEGDVIEIVRAVAGG